MTNELENKIIISTRPKGKSEELKALFGNKGATFYEYPMIAVHPKVLNDQIKNEFEKITIYNYLAFTSANAFRIFHDFLAQLLPDFKINDHFKIASIGYKTSKVIQSFGYRVDFDAQAKTGEEFANKLKLYLDNEAPQKLLWPTGNLSPDILLSTIPKRHSVTRVDIYENKFPEFVDQEITDRIKTDQYHIIIVASPSAIINLNQTVQKKDIKIACIGNVTANAAKELGIIPSVIAEQPNAKGILDAVSAYFKAEYFKTNL